MEGGMLIWGFPVSELAGLTRLTDRNGKNTHPNRPDPPVLVTLQRAPLWMSSATQWPDLEAASLNIATTNN